MRAFRWLNLRRFLEHRARTLLSLSGIAVGAALVVGVLGLLGSLTGSIESFVDDLSGFADLEISSVSDAGFDEALFFKVSEASGVKAAVPVVRQRGLVNSKPALLLGVDERAKSLGTKISQDRSAELAARAAKPGVLIGKGLATELGNPKQSVTVFSGAGETEVPLLGTIGGAAGKFNQGKFVVGPIPLVQQALGKPGRLDSIFVVAREGQDLEALKRTLSREAGSSAFVDSPSGRARQARATTQSLRFGMLMGVTIALIVGGFLIFNTMSMAALERRRELATLRAMGGRRRHLLKLFLMEAAFLGAVGSSIGAAMGFLVAKRLVESIPGFYASQVEVQVQMHMPGLAVPGALAAGITASVLAAWIPARKAVSVMPAESMRPEGVLESTDEVQGISWRPTLAGLFILSAGFATAVAGPSSVSFVGMAAFMGGTIVCTYGLTQPLAAATAAVARLFGPTGRLAAAALERAPRRAWATSVAVVAGVGMVVAQGGATRNVNSSVARSVGTLESVDLYVSAAAGTTLATDVLLPGEWEHKLDSIPGVANVASSSFLFINYSGNKVVIQGVGNSLGAEPAMAGISPVDRKKVLDGKAAVISTRFGELFGKEQGDVLSLPSPQGRKSIPIVGIIPSFTWERGVVTVGRPVMQAWYGRSGVSDYLLNFEDGSSFQQVRKAVEDFAASSPLPVYISSGSEYLELIRGTVGQVNRLFDALASVVVGAALLAIFNALLISVLERRRELGILRALGVSRRQLRKIVMIEAAALGAVGGVMGIGAGFLAHKASIAAVARQGGMPIEYGFVVAPAAAAFVVGIVMAALGSLEPARRAGSVNIIEAIGYE